MHEVKDSISEQNARENVRIICDHFTGNYAGPLAGGYHNGSLFKSLRKYSTIH